MTADTKYSRNEEHHGPRFRRYLITGLLTAIPLWVTWLLLRFVMRILAGSGGPLIKGIAAAVRPFSETIADIILNPWLQAFLAVFLILVLLYFLGWLATRVIGRRIIESFDRLMEKIPLVKTIYGGVKNIIQTFQKKPEGTQRVVLINYPSQDMKTVGFVTKTMHDAQSGRELASVFVPTTPNPTSGFLEIVPMENITSTDWTVDEAMTFIVSGGTVSPARMHYDKSAKLNRDNPDAGN